MLLKDTRVSHSAIHANVAKKGGASGFGLCAERRPIPRYTVITWSACARNSARRQFVDFFIFFPQRTRVGLRFSSDESPHEFAKNKQNTRNAIATAALLAFQLLVCSAPNISSSSRLNRMDGGVCVYVHISWLCIFFHPLLRRHDI